MEGIIHLASSGKNAREMGKFKSLVLDGKTYSAIVVTGNLTASLDAADYLYVRNSTASLLKAEVTGGSSGGGDTVYKSPRDFTVTHSTSTQLVLSGLSYTPVVEEISKVVEFPASGMATEYTPASNAFAWNSSNKRLTVAGAAFSSTSTFRVELLGPDKRYNQPSDATQTIVLNPDSQNYVGQTLASVSNVASGGTVANYYMNCSAFKNWAIQYEKTGGTDPLRLTVWVTAQDDGTAAASCTYQQVKAAGHTNVSGTTTDSYTADAYLCSLPRVNAKYVKATVTQTGTYGDSDYTIYTKQW